MQVASFAVSFALLAWMSNGLCRWLANDVFNEPREDMAHGWLVPFFSLALLWIRRREICRAVGKPSWAGVLLSLGGVFFFLVGVLGDQVRITQIGAIWLLWTLFYAVWGKRLARTVAFPVAFLLFTVPTSFLDAVTVKLRVVISAIASGLLNGFGIPVLRTGTGLYCLSGEGFSLDVADPCSGMRSIFALTALTAAYAYLTQKTRRGKWLLFFCAVPVAMLGNLARIFSIAVVARFCGQRAATGFYHDYSGLVVFVVAVMIVTWLGGIISKLFKKYEKEAEDGALPPECPSSFGSGRGAALVALPLVVFLALVRVENAPVPQEEPADFLAPRLVALPSYRAMYPFYCQDEQCGAVTESEDPGCPPEKCPRCGGEIGPISIGEKTILPTDTRFLKCNYYDDMGDAWRVTVVVNGKSRQSIHRPEICLPAQGMSLENGHIEDFRLSGGETLAMHCYDIRSRLSASTSRMGHGYFFVSAHHRAAAHVKRILISVRDRAFFRRITRWAMVTVSGEESFTATPERREATAAFLSEFSAMLFADGKPGGGQ